MIARSFRYLIVFALTLNILNVSAYPYQKDSPIKIIRVPYQPNVISGSPYQFPKTVTSETRQVLVPEVMDVMPRFNLDRDAVATGNQKGMSINFADGAYPVYYMPGNANGKFNGKISLLLI